MLHSVSQRNRGARPPGLSTVSQGRWQTAHAAAQQTGRTCVLHLGRLCWMYLSSMERTQLCKGQARRSRSGGLPWAHRSGERTRRGALRRAPCYRGVSKREAAVNLEGATSPQPTWCTLWSRLDQPPSSALRRQCQPLPGQGGNSAEPSVPPPFWVVDAFLATAREQRSMSSGAHTHSITDHHLHADPS